MKIQFVLLVACVAASSVLSAGSSDWQAFKAKHGKSYSAAVDSQRQQAFNQNKQLIDQHNKLAAQGQTHFTMGLNKYSDVPHAEFVKTMNGYKKNTSKAHGFPGAGPGRNNRWRPQPGPPGPPGPGPRPRPGPAPWSTTSTTSTSTTTTTTTTASPTTTVDWRNSGVVTAVKDQGQCGSCWSFSATGSIEGQHAISTGNLVSLSEQNLIDCTTSYGNDGCDGGWMDTAFEYVIANGGIDTESSYAYTGTLGTCSYNSANSGATISSYTDITSGSESALQAAVTSIGPISVAIDASQASFQNYASGVYYESACSTTNLDHAVLVVGYGTDSTAGDYWIVKNSWGTSWGINGYILMARNRNNNCGIATEASYPTV